MEEKTPSQRLTEIIVELRSVWADVVTLDITKETEPMRKIGKALNLIRDARDMMETGLPLMSCFTWGDRWHISASPYSPLCGAEYDMYLEVLPETRVPTCTDCIEKYKADAAVSYRGKGA